MGAFLIWVSFFLIAGAAQGPQPATVIIKVLDTNSSIIPNATAKLVVDGKVKFRGKTTRNGQGVVISKVVPGRYMLKVKAPDFESATRSVEVNAGINRITLVLKIAEIEEEVEVVRDAQERSVDDGFSNFLSKEEIANLPDNPDELEEALRQKAGSRDVVFRIDGFTGGRLPPKSRIASIRIIRSSYDAENHELGFTYVDITTKPGNRRFSGSVQFNLNDEVLNARNPFSQDRFPEQSRNTLLFLDGPIKKDKASFSALYADNRDIATQNIVAFLPSGKINDFVSRRSAGSYLDTGLNYIPFKEVPIKVKYIFSSGNIKNLGIGGFNLVDRGFSTRNRAHDLRFSTSGHVRKRFFNEFRFRYQNNFSETIPQSDGPAIVVLDSFSSGGAGNRVNNTKDRFQIADNLLFGYGKHALKVGGLISYEKLWQTSALNQNGTFLFSNLQDFNLGRPSLFTQNPGVRDVSVSQLQLGVYFQDDFRVRKNLTISAGLRYELQNNISDSNNFSPRLSFTWSPSEKGDLTLRGGIGVFYNFLETGALARVLSEGIDQPSVIIIQNPNFLDPSKGGASQSLSQSFRKLDSNIRNPYVIHSSFGVQKQISRSALRVEYVFQKGVHQFRSRDLNSPVLGVRPNSNFGNIIQTESSAFFTRNSLIVGFSGGVWRKISFAIDYTLSKSISDNGGIFSLPSDNNNLRADQSVTSDDRRHKIYSFVGFKIRRGLRLTTTISVGSPLPFTITTGRDDNGDTNFNDRPASLRRNSGRGKWRKQLDVGLSYTFSFIDRNESDSEEGFSVVTTSEDSSGAFDFDSRKRFSIRLFANARNVLNNTNLNNFVGVQTSPFFRQPISAESSRKVTLGLTFRF